MKLFKVSCFCKFSQSVLIKAECYGDALRLGVQKLREITGESDNCYLTRLASDDVNQIPIAIPITPLVSTAE